MYPLSCWMRCAALVILGCGVVPPNGLVWVSHSLFFSSLAYVNGETIPHQDTIDSPRPRIIHSKLNALLDSSIFPFEISCMEYSDHESGYLALGTHDGQVFVMMRQRQKDDYQNIVQGIGQGGPLIPHSRVEVLRWADLDGDGHIDLIACLESTSNEAEQDTQLQLLFNNDGTFSNVYGQPLPITLEDLGGEKLPIRCVDLQVADLDGDGQVEILLSLFRAQQQDSSAMQPTQSTEDIRNGKVVILSTIALEDAQAAMSGEGNGPRPSLTSPISPWRQPRQEGAYQWIRMATRGPSKLLVADFDMDGRMDLASVSPAGGGISYNRLGTSMAAAKGQDGQNSEEAATCGAFLESVDIPELLDAGSHTIALHPSSTSQYPNLVSVGPGRITVHHNHQGKFQGFLHHYHGVQKFNPRRIQVSNLRRWDMERYNGSTTSTSDDVVLVQPSSFLLATEPLPTNPLGQLLFMDWNPRTNSWYTRYQDLETLFQHKASTISDFVVADYNRDGRLDVIFASKESRHLLIMYGEDAADHIHEDSVT